MNRFKTYDANLHGDDYVVGDIHGCFTKLENLLSTIGFNEEVDRLFSVGDLVDRGPENERCIEFLNKPWFHAVRGNHEQMIIDAYKYGESPELSIMNGGMWIYGLPDVERQCYAALFDELPYAMQVDTGERLIGIVHAECPTLDWAQFKDALSRPPKDDMNDRSIAQASIWARTRISYQETSVIQNINRVFCGHTPVDRPCTLGNVTYIDTGACFGRKLTIVRMEDLKVYDQF